MYLLDAEDATIDALKEAWASIGDSIVGGGGRGTVELPRPHRRHRRGDRGRDRGRPPLQIRVTDLIEQVEEEAWVREHTGVAVAGGLGGTSDPVPGAAPTQHATTAVVAVAGGRRPARLFTSMGVSALGRVVSR